MVIRGWVKGGQRGDGRVRVTIMGRVQAGNKEIC